MKIKNILSVLVLITATLFSNSIYGACNSLETGDPVTIKYEVSPNKTEFLKGETATITYKVDGEVFEGPTSIDTSTLSVSKLDKEVGISYAGTPSDAEGVDCTLSFKYTVFEYLDEDSSPYEKNLVQFFDSDAVNAKAQDLFTSIKPDSTKIAAHMKSLLKDATNNWSKEITVDFGLKEVTIVTEQQATNWINSSINSIVANVKSGITQFNTKVESGITQMTTSLVESANDLSDKVSFESTYQYKSYARNNGDPGWGDLRCRVTKVDGISVSVAVSFEVELGVSIGAEASTKASVEVSIEGSLAYDGGSTQKLAPNNTPTLNGYYFPKMRWTVKGSGGGGVLVKVVVGAGATGTIGDSSDKVKGTIQASGIVNQ